MEITAAYKKQLIKLHKTHKHYLPEHWRTTMLHYLISHRDPGTVMRKGLAKDDTDYWESLGFSEEDAIGIFNYTLWVYPVDVYMCKDSVDEHIADGDQT